MCTGMILSNYKLFLNPLFKLTSIEEVLRFFGLGGTGCSGVFVFRLRGVWIGNFVT